MTIRPFARFTAVALAAGTLAAALSACAPLVVGGAVVTGMVATDRRTSGTQLEDQGIELRANAAMRENFGTQVNVNPTSFNRQVLLTGEVPSEEVKRQVEQLVSRVQNVRSVVNELGVMAPSSLSQRSNDALITGRVKASLVDSKDIFANSFNVTTARGVTYLMGRVTQREANRATEIVRGISGVQRVVRVLEIISEDELRQMQAPAASNNANPSPRN
ncbi:MAG: BON domain-containing protein [Burkholderiaceae bacterium]|nr:BON domain-containing protein [Burkholderiaceae bacterium]